MIKVHTRRQWLALAGMVAIGLVLVGSYISYRVGLLPPSASSAEQQFEIKSGERVPQIADRLKAAGLIRGRNSFISYLNFHNLRSRIKVGTYSLSPSLSGTQVAEILVGGKTLSSRLVIPEGYRVSQIKQRAIELGMSKSSLEAALKGTYDHGFLNDRPSNADLEGYLFPDSYHIDSATTATQLVTAMLNNFGQKVARPEYTNAFKAQGLTMFEAVTLASLVEREVSIPADRPIVAQIFLKRLEIGMRLDSDASTEYAAGKLGVAFNTSLDSPYNTRRVSGLPPGPICNPGVTSLDAVAHPAGTDYLYFLSGKDGKTYFSKTYEEHQRNIAKYL